MNEVDQEFEFELEIHEDVILGEKRGSELG